MGLFVKVFLPTNKNFWGQILGNFLKYFFGDIGLLFKGFCHFSD